MTFDIEWALEDEDWDEAASVSRRETVCSEYDVSFYACDGLLPGRLWFKTDTTLLEPFDHAAVVSKWFFAPNNVKSDLHETEFAQGFFLRLLDFAVQLQHILDDREIVDSELAYRVFRTQWVHCECASISRMAICSSIHPSARDGG